MMAEGHGDPAGVSAGVWRDRLMHSDEEITPELLGASEVSCEVIAMAKEPGWRGDMEVTLGREAVSSGLLSSGLSGVQEAALQWVLLCSELQQSISQGDLNLGQIS